MLKVNTASWPIKDRGLGMKARKVDGASTGISGKGGSN